MNHDEQKTIIDHEAALKSAMLHSNIETLDKLIAPNLLFTNHLGQLMTKQQDLDAHKSGMVKINKLETSEQKNIMQGSVAIVFVRAHIEGIFNGQAAGGEFRFTRVWSHKSGSLWQIIAGHSTIIQ